MKTTVTNTDSTAIAVAGYQNDILTIKFRGGRRYAYNGVPQSTFKQLISATSMGKFFHTHIRGMFQFQLV